MLRASEFLQMSGRAGRRGMDEVGHVVVLRHPFEHVEDVAKLASAPPDPLSSRFTPSYGMVLNLLQRHSGAESRELIERSFGQFVINRELEPLFEQKMAIESELKHLSKPLCPDEIGDLPAYRRLVEAQNTKAKQIKLIRRGGQGVSDPVMDRAVLDLQREVDEVAGSAHAMPCHRCPVQKPCSKQGERLRTLANRLKETDRRISVETIKYWKGFESLSNILRMQGYLNADTVTDLGKMAASIRATNELFICEVIISGLLNHLSVPEFAAVLTALVTDAQSRPDDVSSARISPGVEVVLDKVNKLARKVFVLQRDFGIEIPVETSPLFCGLTQMWVEGATWEQIRLATYFDEGIVVRALRRTVDLCRQIAIAPKVPAHIAQKAIDAERLLARDEVREDY